MGFQVLDRPLPGLVVLQPDVFGDARGFFMELYNQQHFEAIGLGNLTFIQDNLSQSTKGTLRGLHFQAPPHAQGKLVTVIQGSVLDVAVDIRKGSPTYGQSYQKVIDDQTRTMLYIPPGFAHGFQVLSDQCLFLYKCANVYHKASEGGLYWNDPTLGINWENIDPILSEKDKHYPTLAELVSPFEYEGV